MVKSAHRPPPPPSAPPIYKENTSPTEHSFTSDLKTATICIKAAHQHLTTALAMPFAKLIPPSERQRLHEHRHRLNILRKSLRRITKVTAQFRLDEIAKSGYPINTTIPAETPGKSQSRQMRHSNRVE